MLNKYIIDAKKDVLDLFDIGLEDFNYTRKPSAIYVSADYESDTEIQVQIKFYKTTRGDKRMSIPNLRKYAEVGDYVWFEIIPIRDSVHHFRINISKELPLDEERYEQLQVRYG